MSSEAATKNATQELLQARDILVKEGNKLVYENEDLKSQVAQAQHQISGANAQTNMANSALQVIRDAVAFRRLSDELVRRAEGCERQKLAKVAATINAARKQLEETVKALPEPLPVYP